MSTLFLRAMQNGQNHDRAEIYAPEFRHGNPDPIGSVRPEDARHGDIQPGNKIYAVYAKQGFQPFVAFASRFYRKTCEKSEQSHHFISEKVVIEHQSHFLKIKQSVACAVIFPFLTTVSCAKYTSKIIAAHTATPRRFPPFPRIKGIRTRHNDKTERDEHGPKLNQKHENSERYDRDDIDRRSNSSGFLFMSDSSVFHTDPWDFVTVFRLPPPKRFVPGLFSM